MLTGFWPPTNEMLRKFSTDPNQNPGGWQGENWEGRGYNIYAYFPEFPGGVGSNPKGNGDFEVDYQDVSSDFERITDDIHPVAILSYGKGQGQWEIEYNARNLSSWNSDYLDPFGPTPSPPDGGKPAGYVRNSTLPVQDIADAINSSGAGVNAWVDWDGDAGAFLCEYMAYRDAWYQELHSDPCDQYRCLAAGSTHVSGSLSVSTATTVCEIALRSVIDYLDSQLVSYIVSGTITFDGVPLDGVIMNGLPGNPVTDADGFYLAEVGSGWSGTVAPVKEGYEFEPPERTYSNVINDQSYQDYTAFPAAPQTIEFDNTSSYSSSTASKTFSWLHTIGSGDNRVLIIAAVSGDNLAVDQVISGVKYNDANMTKLPGSSESRGYIKADLYYMLEADLPSLPGSYTVSVTYNGNVSVWAGGVVSLKNVKQQTPEAVATNSLYSASSISTNINTFSGGAWIVDVVGHSNNGFFSTPTSLERWDQGTGVITGACSTNVVTSAGLTSMSWNFNGSNAPMVHSLAALVPAQTVMPWDNFDDNRRSAIWRTSTDDYRNVAVAEDANRLNLNATGEGGNLVADYVANGWKLDVANDFRFKIDFHCSDVGIGDGWVGITIENDDSNYVTISAGSDNSGPYLRYEVVRDGNSVFDTQQRDSNDGTLYVSYDAGLDELYLSSTGYGAANAWQRLLGLLQAQWASEPVSLAIGGGSDGSAIGNGQAYLDNFEVASAVLFDWPVASDLNKDGFVDWLDAEAMSGYWLQLGSGIEGDLNKDGIVDFADFAALAIAW